MKNKPLYSMSSLVLAALMTATVSCAPVPDSLEPPPTEGETTPSQSAIDVPKVKPPRAVLPDGFGVILELAITPDELAQGLMYRPSLAVNRGMLLVFNEERFPNIWMMNTLVALDIIYLDQQGVVVDVITDAQPCPAEPCPRFTPRKAARAVLEVPAGIASQHGVVEGVQLTIKRVPDFPTDE